MKHLKDFKLNEEFQSKEFSKENPELYNFFKNYIIGKMIEDYEFTDLFLGNDRVKEIMEMKFNMSFPRIKESLDIISGGLGNLLEKEIKKI